MTTRSRRISLAGLTALLVPALTACPMAEDPSGDEDLVAFQLSAPESAGAGNPFPLTIEAVGSEGTTPFEGFSGTVTLSVSSGDISPENADLTEGTATVDTTVTGADGQVTIAAESGDASGSTSLTIGSDGFSGESWGDPHQITFDGMKYDFMSVGEFMLVESDSGDLSIQVRQEPWGNSDRVSVNTAVATEVDGQRVALYVDEEPPLLIDGTPTAVPDGGSTSVGAGAVYRDGTSNTIVYPNGEQLRVRIRPGRMDIRVHLNPSRAGNVAGLLGNADGDLGNEFARRDGTVFSQPISYEDMYTDTNTFDESWRISGEESLFDYAPGEDTGTFTDTSLPVAYASTGDLSPTAYENARSTCEEAGVTDPIVLDACILDVGMTGEPDFAADSAAAGSPTSSLAVTPETKDVALLHSEDTSAATAYEAGLEARGFEVSLVLIGSTESSNASLLSEYDLLLVDTFTGSLATWDGGEKVVNAIQQSGRPVIGLGEGGYAYLGQVSSPIGYPNGLRGSGLDAFSPFTPQHPSLAGPRSVDTSGGSVSVSTSGMSYVSIHIQDMPTTVERVGDTSQDYSVVIADTATSGSALWGFDGVPSDYTSDGWNALANLGNYLIGLP